MSFALGEESWFIFSFFLELWLFWTLWLRCLHSHTIPTNCTSLKPAITLKVRDSEECRDLQAGLPEGPAVVRCPEGIGALAPSTSSWVTLPRPASEGSFIRVGASHLVIAGLFCKHASDSTENEQNVFQSGGVHLCTSVSDLWAFQLPPVALSVF